MQPVRPVLGAGSGAVAAVLLAALSSLPAHAQGPGAETGVAVRPSQATVAWIPIENHVDQFTFHTLESRVRAALSHEPRFIVFDLITDSGDYLIAPDLADSIRALQEGAGIISVAYLQRPSSATTTMVAFACEEIAMREGVSSIGGCELLDTWFGPFAKEADGERASRWQEKLIQLAERHDQESGGIAPGAEGPWQALARGMCVRDTEVLRVRLEDGTWELVTRQTLEASWSAAKRRAIKEREVIGNPPYLLMGAEQARDLGIARYLVSGREHLLSELAQEHGFEAADLVVVEIAAPAWETVIRFLNLSWVRVALLAIGLVGLSLAMLVQGQGIPEVVMVVAFGLFFFSSYLIGLADWVEVILFVIGLALVAAEIFITPGFGLLGGTGLLLLLASLVLAMQSFVIPSDSYEWQQVGVSVFTTTIALVLGFGVCALALRFLPKRSFAGLVLMDEQAASLGYDVASSDLQGLVGKRGQAVTVLRTAGKIEIDGQQVDVCTDGDYVEAGTMVTVLRVEGNRIFVAPVRGDDS